MSLRIYKQTKEHRKRIGKANKGKKRSEEVKKKMRGDNNPAKRLDVRKKISKALKGIKRGPYSEEHREKISKSNKKVKHTKIWNKKVGIANTGKRKTKEMRKKQSERMISRYKLGEKFGFQKGHKLYAKLKDTSIELKMETELKKRNINYQKQIYLCKIATVDFYLSGYRIVIQCDGDYWHNLPEVKERDERQDKVLIFNGFNVYRFWEHEINDSVEECINQLKPLLEDD